MCGTGYCYIIGVIFTFTAGGRLHNFKIRVGNDIDYLNNAICYEQSEAMGPGEIRDFTCYNEIHGIWVSVDKPDDILHFQEVRVYGSKYKLWLLKGLKYAAGRYIVWFESF